MRGSPELPTRLCRRIMLEALPPSLWPTMPTFLKCMPWSNLAWTARDRSDGSNLVEFRRFIPLCENSIRSTRATGPVWKAI